jgi:hypothetical protein
MYIHVYVWCLVTPCEFCDSSKFKITCLQHSVYRCRSRNRIKCLLNIEGNLNFAGTPQAAYHSHALSDPVSNVCCCQEADVIRCFVSLLSSFSSRWPLVAASLLPLLLLPPGRLRLRLLIHVNLIWTARL